MCLIRSQVNWSATKHRSDHRIQCQFHRRRALDKGVSIRNLLKTSQQIKSSSGMVPRKGANYSTDHDQEIGELKICHVTLHMNLHSDKTSDLERRVWSWQWKQAHVSNPRQKSISPIMLDPGEDKCCTSPKLYLNKGIHPKSERLAPNNRETYFCCAWRPKLEDCSNGARVRHKELWILWANEVCTAKSSRHLYAT